MLAKHTTLVRFLIEERRAHPDASGELNALILDAALACRAIANRVAQGELGDAPGSADPATRAIQARAEEYFLRACEWGGQVAGILSARQDGLYSLPAQYPRGNYLLIFHPLDGAEDLDVNVSAGSIFSILRAPHAGRDASAEDFLQPGTEQVCAGYAIYGPSTMLVLTVGTGVHGFTLDRGLGEFFLSRPSIRMPADAAEFAIDAANRRFWEPAVQRYIDECLDGQAGRRGRDFTMRWVASLVADTHRILTRGGVFLNPRDSRDSWAGRLGLLYEANPIAMLVEQAGGLASTGHGRLLEQVPADIHQRVPLIFGTADEVRLIERYHRESNDRPSSAPLYGSRGLFRSQAR